MSVSRLFLAVLFIPALLGAQSADTAGQRGRTLIAVSLGLTSKRVATVDGSNISASSSGQVASLAMTHFVHPSIAVELSAAVLDAAVDGIGHTESVIPILFGLKWAPASIALDATVRPFLSIAAGPYVRSATDLWGVTGVSASTQSVLGARAGTGANWYLSRHFALQLEGDYHAVPAFDAVNGTRRNVSGFALSAGLGIAWGGR